MPMEIVRVFEFYCDSGNCHKHIDVYQGEQGDVRVAKDARSYIETEGWNIKRIKDRHLYFCELHIA